MPTLALFGIGLLFVAAMWFGWRGRKRRFAHIPAPPAAEPTDAGYAGQYIATTLAGEPLERINVHGLGVRTKAGLLVTPSEVVLSLNGRGPFAIPARDLRDVSLGSGMIGKFVERDGIIIIRWQLGHTEVDTGFRPTESRAAHVIAEEIAQLKGRD